VIVPKQRWSSFFQTNFDLQLRVRGIDTIVIAGGLTDVGIASTVFAARDLDYRIGGARRLLFVARTQSRFLHGRVFRAWRG
jgi:hypothetical protein